MRSRFLLAASVALTVLVAQAAGVPLAGPGLAHADEEAPIRAGASLVARGDCELEKVTIARGSRVEVTAVSGNKANVLLPDGYVLRGIALARLRYFFDVVR